MQEPRVFFLSARPLYGTRSGMKFRLALALSLACAASLRAQTMEDIHNFRHDGKAPLGRLLLEDGDYYGTTAGGGLSQYSSGTIFKDNRSVPSSTVLIRGKETVHVQPLINDTFTYTVTDRFGGQASGTVKIVNPFIPLAGSYEPLIGDDDGIATLKVTTGGLLTGKVKLGTKTYTLKGLIGFDGAFTQAITRKGLPDLQVAFQFTNPSQIATITGTVDGLPVSSDVKLTTTIPAPAFPAKYTIVLDPIALLPQNLDAYGWATASLTSKGAFAMAGLTPGRTHYPLSRSNR